MPLKPIGKRLSAGQVGNAWEEKAQANATEQQAFVWDHKQTVFDDISGLYAMARAAITAAGGLDWLASALDREPSYSSKISEALNRRDERRVHLDWLAPLLSDAKAMELILGWLCERGGFEPPKRKRVATRDELYGALLEAVEESGPAGEALKERAAKRLGTDKGAFRK